MGLDGRSRFPGLPLPRLVQLYILFRVARHHLLRRPWIVVSGVMLDQGTHPRRKLVGVLVACNLRVRYAKNTRIGVDGARGWLKLTAIDGREQGAQIRIRAHVMLRRATTLGGMRPKDPPSTPVTPTQFTRNRACSRGQYGHVHGRNGRTLHARLGDDGGLYPLPQLVQILVHPLEHTDLVDGTFLGIDIGLVTVFCRLCRPVVVFVFVVGYLDDQVAVIR